MVEKLYLLKSPLMLRNSSLISDEVASVWGNLTEYLGLISQQRALIPQIFLVTLPDWGEVVQRGEEISDSGGSFLE